MSDAQQMAEAKEAMAKKIRNNITAGILKEFSGEALSKDSSRGFDLTSIKAQYIVERLNEVFGVDGWDARYDVVTLDPEKGCIMKCLLSAKVAGMNPIIRMAFGGCGPKKNLGDMSKSAMTDALGKAASHMGIGNEVFKGKVKPPGSKSAYKKAPSKISKKDEF